MHWSVPRMGEQCLQAHATNSDCIHARAVLGAIYGLQVRTTVSGGAHPAMSGCAPWLCSMYLCSGVLFHVSTLVLETVLATLI